MKLGVNDIDNIVAKSLEKHWDITPFKCVNEEEFKESRTVHYSRLGFYSYGTDDMISPNFAVFFAKLLQNISRI